jgi:hypothetical protein
VIGLEMLLGGGVVYSFYLMLHGKICRIPMCLSCDNNPTLIRMTKQMEHLINQIISY